MAEGNSLRDEIRAQNKNVKNMTFSQKCSHIWGYYKIHIVGTILVVVMVISVVLGMKANHYDKMCTTLVIDGYMTGFADNTDALTQGFTHYLGIDGKKQRVIFNNNFSLIHLEGDLDAYYSYEKIVSMAATASFDGFMAEKEYIDYFSDDEELFLTDLTELLSATQLQKIGDSLIYYTYEDGTKVPFAVDLTHTKVKSETDLTMTTPCYGIVTTAPNKQNAASFIKYAFDIE